ncbi:MAG: competence/damage-inducible protein A [Methanoregulaceae archaeon]|nr:competence/damage-inducible protein A [Methanoregulaceae archaeon]
MKVCEVISVGTELLMGQIADTDAQAIGRLLPELGIAHYHRQTVGDNLDRLVGALQLALSRSDVVITIGGLGPTEDDLTREAIAAALGVSLETDEQFAQVLRRMFATRNLPWVDSQFRQAQRPAGAKFLDNPNGSAPGLWCRRGSQVIVAMPGPPGEFMPMLSGPVRERLIREFGGAETLHSRILRVCGLGESVVEDRLRDLLSSTNPTIAPYAKPGEVHLRLTARGDASLLDPLVAEVRRRLGDSVFGEGDETLELVVLALTRERGWKLGVAESLTGGLVGARLTSVPGASDTFAGGIIAYTPSQKSSLLGIPVELLRAEGLVSSASAEAMAHGCREKLGVEMAIATTGNAGPTADVDGKPVGLTYVSVSTPHGTHVEEFKFRGTRDGNRTRAAQAALTLAYRVLRG